MCALYVEINMKLILRIYLCTKADEEQGYKIIPELTMDYGIKCLEVTQRQLFHMPEICSYPGHIFMESVPDP